MSGSSDLPVDLNAVLGRLNGDRELLAELAGLYLEDEPTLVAELEAADGGGDAEAIRRAAHAIKGCVANFAAAPDQAAALALENAGRGGELTSTPALLDTLRAELAAVRQALSGLAPGR